MGRTTRQVVHAGAMVRPERHLRRDEDRADGQEHSGVGAHARRTAAIVPDRDQFWTHVYVFSPHQAGVSD
ncbi:MAG TPA: hypothetical protein VFP30_01610 [Candidatus Limnocylindria bacterium]|nr:hypothetical protein [Candidatus Limnocylindria bacterium]